MSAFMHTTKHVDAIIHGAMTRTDARYIVYGNPSRTLADDPTNAGRVLLRENAESMAFRYNMKDLENPADGGTRSIEYLEYLQQVDDYEYKVGQFKKPYSVPEILMALHSLEYQSCERPDFEGSEAHQLIRAIESALIRAIPGYQSAETWAIE